MAMTYDQYQNRRSWLVDTAETPADKKKLASDLAKLDAEYKASKAAKGTQADHHVTDNNSHTQPVKPTGSLTGDAAVNEYQRQISPEGMKQSQDNIRKATDKKYPGLYKK